MGPSGKLTQHVSYRKPFELFAICCAEHPVAKIRHACRAFVAIDYALHAYLRVQIDLIFKEFIKSQESTWETLWSPRRPSGDPKRHPKDPQGASQGTSHRTKTPISHRPGVDLTSTSHRSHIELTSNSHRPHIEHTESKPYYKCFIGSVNSRYLAFGDRMLYHSYRTGTTSRT